MDEPGDVSPSRPGREPSAEDERELRILLERAVPRLPAPEGRLGRVRERVRRTRRLRGAAGGAAVTVTTLVLAGTFLPGALRGGQEAAPPAAPGPSVTGSSEGTGSQDPAGGLRPTPGQDPAPGQDSAAAGVRFERLGGLTLRLPERWQALEMPYDKTFKVAARGFVSSGRLTPYRQPCPVKTPDACLPVKVLARGGALLTLTPLGGTDMSGKIQRPPVLYASGELSKTCGGIRGTREFSALIGGASASAASSSAISVTLCVSGDAPGTVEDVRAMLTGADFGKGTTTAPTPTPTDEHPLNEK